MIQDDVGGEQPRPQQPAVGPRTPPRPRLIVELDEKIAGLEQNTAQAVNSLDDDIGQVWEVTRLLVTMVGTLHQAISALTDDPNNPISSAAAARDILDNTEAAYGTDTGPEDDGVVPEPAGDQSGDS